MGLEIAELIPSVENSFGFAIPDEDAAGLLTLGELFDYIAAHRFRGYQEDCLGGITFYKLRLRSDLDPARPQGEDSDID